MGFEVDVRRLHLFNEMAREGSTTVADHLTTMTGLDAAVRSTQINFLDVGDVETHLGTDDVVALYVELEEPPYGYVLFVLSPADSKRLARAMTGGVGGDRDRDGPKGPGESADAADFTDMERSAIQEVANVMTSGFVDGWANVLRTTIDISTPRFTHGPADGILDGMGGWPGSELAFVIDSHIVADDRDFDLTVYTFPELEALVDLIQDIGLDTDVAAESTASRDVVE